MSMYECSGGIMQMEKLKELPVSLAVDFKASRTGDGISALPNPTGGGRGVGVGDGGGGGCTLLMHQLV